jgi:hypothetical protein
VPALVGDDALQAVPEARERRPGALEQPEQGPLAGREHDPLEDEVVEANGGA